MGRWVQVLLISDFWPWEFGVCVGHRWEAVSKKWIQQIALFTRVLLMCFQLGLDSLSIATPNLEHKERNIYKEICWMCTFMNFLRCCTGQWADGLIWIVAQNLRATSDCTKFNLSSNQHGGFWAADYGWSFGNHSHACFVPRCCFAIAKVTGPGSVSDVFQLLYILSAFTVATFTENSRSFESICRISVQIW